MGAKARKSLVGRAVDQIEREERWARRWRRVFLVAWFAAAFAIGWFASKIAGELLPMAPMVGP